MIQSTNKNLGIKYKRLFNLLLLVFLVIKINCFGQSTKSDTLATTDTTNYSDVDFNFFMMDFSYTNNKIKTKTSESDMKIPAFLSDFTFLHKTGVYANMAFANFTGADTLTYDYELRLGYQKSFFNEALDVDFSYYYHGVGGMDDYKGIDYNHALDVSLGGTYRFIYAYTNGNFYLDNENYFTDFGINFIVDFEGIFSKDDYLFIMPGISTSFGTDTWIYDIYKPVIENNMAYIRYYLFNQGYQVANLTSEQAFDYYLIERGVSTNTYSYHGLDLSAPIIYGINSVAVSLAYLYYFPSDKLELFGIKEQSGFMVSLSFIF